MRIRVKFWNSRTKQRSHLLSLNPNSINKHMGYVVNTPFGTINQGSWFALPDLGLTERAAQKVSSGQTTDLSKAITGDYGSGATGNWDTQKTINVPVNTPQVPINNPDPQRSTQPQNQVSISGNFMDYYPGWNQSSAQADFMAQYGGDIGRLAAAKGGGSSGGGSNDLLSQIESLYGPTLLALTEQENVAQGTRDTDIETANVNKQKSLDELLRQYNESSNVLGTQESNLIGARQQAIDLARRTLSAQRQQAMARYGTGSSTGGAVSEILNQEFLRGQYGVEKNYASELGNIQQKARAYKEAADQGEKYINEQSEIAIKQINGAFRQRMADIQMAKAQTDQGKTQMKIQILQDAINQTRAIQQRKQDMQDQLAMFKSQTDYQIKTGIASIQNKFAPYAGLTTSIDLPTFAPLPQTPAAIYNQYNPNPRKIDEFGNIINP